MKVTVSLEFGPGKGVNANALEARVIDKSIIEQPVEEKFFEKFFGKELR